MKLINYRLSLESAVGVAGFGWRVPPLLAASAVRDSVIFGYPVLGGRDPTSSLLRYHPPWPLSRLLDGCVGRRVLDLISNARGLNPGSCLPNTRSDSQQDIKWTPSHCRCPLSAFDSFKDPRRSVPPPLVFPLLTFSYLSPSHSLLSLLFPLSSVSPLPIQRPAFGFLTHWP